MLKLKRIGTTEQKTRTKKNNFIKDKDGNQKTSLTTIQLKLPGLNINSQMQTKRKSIRNSQSSMPIQRIDYFPQYSILKKDSLKEKYHCIDLTITLTDGLSFLLDVIIIVCLYVNHFQYNKHKYSLSKKDNTLRMYEEWISNGELSLYDIILWRFVSL